MQKQQASTAQPSELEQNFHFGDSLVQLETNLLGSNKTMAAQRTLRELAIPNVNQQPLCITYTDTEQSFELKSGLIHLLPTVILDFDDHKNTLKCLSNSLQI